MRPAYTRLEDRDVNRRAWTRRRTLLAAKLAVDDPAVVVNCGVRNISEGGALVELESTTLLRPPFRLLTIRDGVIFDADLIWSWGHKVGLRFTAEHRPEMAPTPHTLMLRRIWSAVRV